MRYSDGSYLEDQDFWLMSGIQRDVTLYSKPKVALEDLVVQTNRRSLHRRGIEHRGADHARAVDGGVFR